MAAAGESPARYYISASEIDGVAVCTLGDRVAGVEIAFAPARGGEWVSFTHQGRQLMDRGLQMSPPSPASRWAGHAPILWPAVGRQRDGGAYIPPGESTARIMPLHGFAKDCAFTVEDLDASDSEASVSMVLTHADCAAFAAAFPYSFKLVVKVTLSAGLVTLAHTVAHTGSGGDASTLMPFAIGNHLTLRFPLLEGAADWASGRIQSSVTHEYELTSGSLLSGVLRPEPAFGDGSGMPLTTPCATNGVFGTPAPAEAACWLRVVQPHVLAVEVTHAITQGPERVADDDATQTWLAHANSHRHFVLWGEPPVSGESAGFICPEPWVTGPDSLNTRAGLPLLRAGESATWTMTVGVHVLS